MSWRGAKPTSIQLSSRDNNHQEVSPRVLSRDVVADQHSQWGDDEHRQELQAHDALQPRVRRSAFFPHSPVCFGAVVQSSPVKQCISQETYRVRTSPSLVRARVDHPQLREGVVGARGLGAPDAVVMAKVALLGRVVAA